jgi:hypothetical protein
VALEPTVLIEPQGRLQAGLFPDGDIVTRVTAWLATAYTKVGGITGSLQDAAATAYTYYLAYSHVADRLANEPNSVSVDSAANVSKAVGQDRIAYFSRLAQKYLDEYEGYLSTPANPERPRSGWVRNQPVF